MHSAAGPRSCQDTYSEGQTCLGWQRQVNSQTAVYERSPTQVSCERNPTSHDIDLRFRV